MSFGFPPTYQLEETIEGLNQKQLFALIIDTLNALEWKISYKNPAKVIAFTSSIMFTYQYEITISIEGNLIKITSSSLGSELFDMNRNKKNVNRFFAKFVYLKEKSDIQQLTTSYDELNKTFINNENENINQTHKSSTKKLKGFFSIFIPIEGFYITPIILNLNIIVFILMLINGSDLFIPDNQIAISWGANFRPLTIDGGQWWRILTCTFIHAGIIHLLMNMYALLYIGLLLEPYLGKLKFATFYVLTGIAASTTSLCWHDFTVCVGASGAIFGLYGVFLAMLTTNIIEKTARGAFLTSIGIFVAYNLMNGAKDSNIDNAAHIGGLITGMILGYGAYFSLKSPFNEQIQNITVLISTVVVVVVITIVFSQFPKNFAKYDKQMNEFAKLEVEAMKIYSCKSTNIETQKYLVSSGIYMWEKCNSILDSVEKLDLPVNIAVRTDKLKEYVKLRIETYNMLMDRISGDTSNTVKLKLKCQKIESIINNLQNK
jgi:rhomboid protease GluP